MSAAIGALVIGDEILVGKRKDKHFEFLVAALAARGLRLAYCEYHGDDPARLSAALRRTFASGDIVFSFGGIGATPDDHTRQCAGDALGVALAAFAGMLAAPVASVYPGMGNQVLIISFVVIVIGGIGSVKGALVAALLIGLADVFGQVVFPHIAGMTVYLVMAAVLLWRPRGLFGSA